MSPRLVLAAAVFAALALGVSPAHWWLDAGELTAAGAEWGVSHPPGAHGLAPALLVGTGLGLGSLGFRMGLVCAALGTAAVMLLVDVAARRGVRTPGLWWMAAWIVVGLTFARNVRVVEIYGLSAVLTFATLWGLDPTQARRSHPRPRADDASPAPDVVEAERPPRSADSTTASSRAGAVLAVTQHGPAGPRLVAVAAATLGAWGFGDLRLVLPPLLALALVLARRRGETWVRWAPLVAAVASLPAVSTVLASHSGPTVDWGNPQSFGAWWDHVTARSIREAFAQDMFGATALRRWVDARAAMARLVEDVGWLGVLVAPIAVVTFVRRREGVEAWWPWLFVLLGQAVYAVFVNPMGGVDRQTGLVAAMIVVLLGVTWLAGHAQRWVDGIGERRSRAAATALVCVVAASSLAQPAVTSWSDAAATRSWMPHAWASRALAGLPPRTLLLTQSDDLSAALLAARALEGARPDVAWAVAQHLHKPGPDHAWPEALAVLDAARAGSSETERVQRVAAMAGRGRALATIAVESPSTGVLAAVDAFADSGPLPVTVLAASATPRGAARLDELVAWGAMYAPEADRVRVAHAIVVDVEGQLNRAARSGEILERARLGELESRLHAAIELSDGALIGAWVDAAVLADRRGARGEARELLERALDRDPERVSALVQLGRIEGTASSPDVVARGRARLERAVALDPRRTAAWRALAQLCADQGDAACEAEARTHLQGIE